MSALIIQESFWRRLWLLVRHPLSVERVAVENEAKLIVENRELKYKLDVLESEKKILEIEIKNLVLVVQRNQKRVENEIIEDAVRLSVAQATAARLKIPSM